MLTIIAKPSQLGLEVFHTPHPMQRAAHETALGIQRQGQKPDGEAGAGEASKGRWVAGFEADELSSFKEDTFTPYSSDDGDGRDDGWTDLVLMGGDMLALATGGILPATRHRVTCTWDTDAAVRFSLIVGLYGADTATLQPRTFREKVCGLAPWDGCPGDVNAKASRTNKLYLDYDQTGKS
jgi:hypothetical protein